MAVPCDLPPCQPAVVMYLSPLHCHALLCYISVLCVAVPWDLPPTDPNCCSSVPEPIALLHSCVTLLCINCIINVHLCEWLSCGTCPQMDHCGFSSLCVAVFGPAPRWNSQALEETPPECRFDLRLLPHVVGGECEDEATKTPCPCLGRGVSRVGLHGGP